MSKYELNLMGYEHDLITLDDLITNMDSYDSSVYEAANDEYYGGVITTDHVLN